MQFRDHPGVQGKRDAYPFDPRLLKIDAGYNVRDLSTTDDADRELKESIRANGVRVPLEVRLVDDDVFVVAGHRRHKMVMELINEGEEIKSVPVMPEPKFTSDGDRILNLVISNSGKPLKPLEIAEVVRRLVAFGWDKPQIAKRIGWKSAASVTQHLELLAMPEPVKEQVRKDDISATEAAKVVKTLPKGTDPAEAAKLIAANKAENKRLGIGKKTNHKVTAKTLKRDKPPKAEAPKPPEPSPESSKPEPHPVLTGSPAEQLAQAGLAVTPEHEEAEPPEPCHGPADTTCPTCGLGLKQPAPPVHPQLQDAAERERPLPPEAFRPPSHAQEIDRKLFEIVGHVVTALEGFDLQEFGDDETIGISINAKIAKQADQLYRSRIGDTSQHARDDGTAVNPDGEPGS